MKYVMLPLFKHDMEYTMQIVTVTVQESREAARRSGARESHSCLNENFRSVSLRKEFENIDLKDVEIEIERSLLIGNYKEKCEVMSMSMRVRMRMTKQIVRIVALGI